VWLVEGGSFEVGAPLSAPVESAVARVADAIVAEVSSTLAPEAPTRG